MNSLNEQIIRIQSAKEQINSSLSNKGIIIPDNTLLNNYPSFIDQIKLGTKSEEVTAKKENILIGTTTIASDSNDQIIEGTMPNNENFSSTINAGSSIILPTGYHNGNGIINVRSLAEETPGNATASRIMSGNTGWVNGIQITGTMTVQSAFGFSASALSATSIRISWTNPSKGPWSGVKIRYSTSGYPGVSGGDLIYTGYGSNSTADGTSYYDVSNLQLGTTYYFTCYSYATGLGDSSSGYNINCKTSGLLLYGNGKAYYTIEGRDPNNHTVTVNSNGITSTHIAIGYGSTVYINVGNMDLTPYSRMRMNLSVGSKRYTYVIARAGYIASSGGTLRMRTDTLTLGGANPTYLDINISSFTYTYGSIGFYIGSNKYYEGNASGGHADFTVSRLWLE